MKYLLSFIERCEDCPFSTSYPLPDTSLRCSEQGMAKVHPYMLDDCCPLSDVEVIKN